MIRKEKHKKQDINQGEEQQRNNPFIRNDGMRKPRNEGTDRKDIPAQDGKDLTEKNSQTSDQQVYKKTDIGTAEANRNGPKCKDIFSMYSDTGLRWWFSGKEATSQCRRCRFDP